MLDRNRYDLIHLPDAVQIDRVHPISPQVTYCELSDGSEGLCTLSTLESSSVNVGRGPNPKGLEAQFVASVPNATSGRSGFGAAARSDEDDVASRIRSKQIHSLVTHILPFKERLLFDQVFGNSATLLEKTFSLGLTTGMPAGELKLRLRSPQRSLSFSVPVTWPTISQSSNAEVDSEVENAVVVASECGYLVPNSPYYVWTGSVGRAVSVVPAVHVIDLAQSTSRSRALDNMFGRSAGNDASAASSQVMLGVDTTPVVKMDGVMLAPQDATGTLDVAMLHQDGTVRVLQVDDRTLVRFFCSSFILFFLFYFLPIVFSVCSNCNDCGVC